MNIFHNVEANLRQLKKREWYTKEQLRKLDLWSQHFEQQENGLLIQKKEASLEILGASVIHYYDALLGLGDQAKYIELDDLALALGNPAIFGFVQAHPEIRYRELEDGNRKHVMVRCDELGRFKDLLLEEKPMNDSNMMGRILFPHFDLPFPVLRYISKNREESVEDLALATKQNPPYIEAALYNLGYRQPRSLERVLEIGEEIFLIRNPGSRKWKDIEKEELRRIYFFAHPSDVAHQLQRNEEEIEYEAALLGLERFSAKEEYTISEVVKLSRILYHDLQQALFRGDLETRIYDIESDEDGKELPPGAVLIKGRSLIRFFQEKKQGKRGKYVRTRADAFVRGEKKNLERIRKAEEIGDYRMMIASRKLWTSLNLLGAYAHVMPLLTPDEEAVLCESKDQDLAARNDLIESNLRAAFWVAHQYKGRLKGKLEFIDLVHEAIVGLTKGVLRYNTKESERRGRDETFRLLTYANWWMHASVRKALENTRDLVRTPVKVHNNSAKVIQAIQYCIQHFYQQPSIQEISEHSGLSPQEVGKVIQLYKRSILSLDLEIMGKEELKLKDTIADCSQMPDREVMENDYREHILEVLEKKCDKRERNVLIWRFGLQGERRTLIEIGELYKIGGEKVRQIEEKALLRLNKDPQLKKLFLS